MDVDATLQIMQALLFLIRSFIQTGWFASQDELVSYSILLP